MRSPSGMHNAASAETYPNCPDCGKLAVCPACGDMATYQTPFDKVFWDSSAHWWRCECITGGHHNEVGELSERSPAQAEERRLK